MSEDYFKSTPNENILLSACLIVKNEEIHIKDCLRSIQDVVDEIVIVDTGSTDRTIEIAKQFNIKLHFFQWVDDFSAARNYCMSKACGEWILQIDADERIQTVSASYLHSLLKNSEFIAYRSIDKNLLHYSSIFGRIRFFRNDKRISYEGIIHESVKDSVEKIVQEEGLTVGMCGVLVEHLGYSQNSQHKFKRDLGLLEKELIRNPENSLNWYRLALIYFHLEKRDKAVSINTKALSLIREKGDYLPGEVIPFHLDVQLKLNKGADIHRSLEEGLQYYPEDPVLIYYTAASFLQNGNYDETIPLCNYLIERGRKKDYDRSIPHPERIFDEYAFDTLATCYFKLSEFSKAIDQYEKAFKCSRNQEYKIKMELCKKLQARN